MMVVVVLVKVMLFWEVDICHKNALSLVVSEWRGLRCACELPEVRKCPASITWTVALLELWMFFFVCFFFVTCRSHSLRGQESVLNLAHFFKFEDNRLVIQGNFNVYSEGYKTKSSYTGGGSSLVKAKQCELLTCFLLKDNKLDEGFWQVMCLFLCLLLLHIERAEGPVPPF